MPGEPAPDAKQLASDTLQAIGTYPVGGGTATAAAQRIDARVAPNVTTEAAPLLVPDAASAIDIVYPQLGGLTETDASVMVVFRQRLVAGAQEHEITRTADVRLLRDAEGWSVSTIASLGGDEPSEPARLSPEAEAVLANDRIDLPDSARWDIEAGRVDPRVLKVLATLAVDHELGVTVLETGHPFKVFGTERTSNHTVGRAVDIWMVDGEPVVSQRDINGPLHALAEQLLAQVTELGAPWDLDGPKLASFTNTVHQDHLHLGFKS